MSHTSAQYTSANHYATLVALAAAQRELASATLDRRRAAARRAVAQWTKHLARLERNVAMYGYRVPHAVPHAVPHVA